MSSGRTSRSDPLKARPMGVRTASMITASGIWDSSVSGEGNGGVSHYKSRKGGQRRAAANLLGRHPQRAVQANRLAVQHRILSDVARERRVLVREAEPGGERDRLAERLAVLLRERGQQRSVEQPRGDGAHADP